MGDEARPSYELEKLLASLSSTFNHMSQYIPSLASSALEQPVTASGSSGSGNGSTSSVVSTSMRVDLVVKRLTDIRAWQRDEFKAKKLLEEKCESLEKDFKVLKSRFESIQTTVKREAASAAEREAGLQDKIKHLAAVEDLATRREDDIKSLRAQISTLTAQVEESRVSKHRHTAEQSQKQAELERSLAELSASGTVLALRPTVLAQY